MEIFIMAEKKESTVLACTRNYFVKGQTPFVQQIKLKWH